MITIFTPTYNRAHTLNQLYQSLLQQDCYDFEWLVINDGSTDNTIKELHNLYEKDIQHVKAISFSRNFKKEAAMLAGLEHASGEYTCIIDADLQQNPKYILEMYDFLENNKEGDFMEWYHILLIIMLSLIVLLLIVLTISYITYKMDGNIQIGIEEDHKLIAGLDACVTAFRILYVSTVFVDEQYRRKGYGR